ncbi:hypothetical protein A3Q56_04546 [Intoshia linei]|uniref:Uncharacterized protein n=1 Tax=Intoshia linei TaxID=1819745 RepID=A0A177B0T6_9BILA|nr:hypothetical protein A3Q56_04546 [Intoshia linei]
MQFLNLLTCFAILGVTFQAPSNIYVAKPTANLKTFIWHGKLMYDLYLYALSIPYSSHVDNVLKIYTFVYDSAFFIYGYIINTNEKFLWDLRFKYWTDTLIKFFFEMYDYYWHHKYNGINIAQIIKYRLAKMKHESVYTSFHLNNIVTDYKNIFSNLNKIYNLLAKPKEELDKIYIKESENKTNDTTHNQ